MGEWEKLVLTCPLSKLLQSQSNETSSVWHNSMDLPIWGSTCVAINEDVLAIGGVNDGDETTTTTLTYNQSTNSWIPANEKFKVQVPRHHCLVAVIGNFLLIVGGYSNSFGDFAEKVEFKN